MLVLLFKTGKFLHDLSVRCIVVLAAMTGMHLAAHAKTSCITFPAAAAFPDVQMFMAAAFGTNDNPFNIALTGNLNHCGKETCYLYIPADSFEIRDSVKLCSRAYHWDPELVVDDVGCRLDLHVRQIVIEAEFGSLRVSRMNLRRCDARNETISDLELATPDHMARNPKKKMLIKTTGELERWTLNIELR